MRMILIQKVVSRTGNRTPSYRVKGGNVSRYTIHDRYISMAERPCPARALVIVYFSTRELEMNLCANDSLIEKGRI